MTRARATFNKCLLAGLLPLLPLPAASSQAPPAGESVSSPGGKLLLPFRLTDSGAPLYALTRVGRPAVRESRLGIELKDRRGLSDGFSLERVDRSNKGETWEPVWGEVRRIRNTPGIFQIKRDYYQPGRKEQVHTKGNPMAYRIDRYRVDARTVLKITLAPGGGAAIALKPASADDVKTLKSYAP